LLAAAHSALPDRAALVQGQSARRTLDLRHSLARYRPRKHPKLAAHHHVEAQLDVRDAGAESLLPASVLRGEKRALVDSVFRLGIRTRVADHHRSKRGPGCDAANDSARAR